MRSFLLFLTEDPIFSVDESCDLMEVLIHIEGKLSFRSDRINLS
jgi:hypothetical protein